MTVGGGGNENGMQIDAKEALDSTNCSHKTPRKETHRTLFVFWWTCLAHLGKLS